MIGQTITHYTILEKLGEGGMGVIYRARDTKLDRMVALKFLPPSVTADRTDKERFLHEARAASALTHPNVTVVYEMGEHADQLFLAMELVEGTTLARLIRGGVLPVKTVVEIATQVCEGLRAAHEKGIVHRDIKSDNIMVTPGGQAKIMDFGLAKIAGATKITKTGSTMGTIAYMSPEQAQGEEVDRRSDIFSFGVVLYEMLTGKLPFRGEHHAAIVYSLMNEEPAPIARFNENVPPGITSIVAKALAKDPAVRYQHIDDLKADLLAAGRASGPGHAVHLAPAAGGFLRRHLRTFALASGAVVASAAVILWLLPGTGPTDEPASGIRRIAVLPFRSLREDPESAYLGFSLADQIITRLSYVRSIAVRPSQAVRKFDRSAIPLSEIGRELNVGLALTGSYLKDGDRFRLNAQLVDIRTNDMLWSQQLDATVGDIFTLQDEVSRRVIEGLKVRLSPEEITRLGKDVPVNPQAYDYYLRAIGRELPRMPDALPLQIRLLRKSIELDSSYAPALALLGWCYRDYANTMEGHGMYYDLAQQYLSAALRVNRDFPFAISGLAILDADLGKIEEAAALLHDALHINPNDPDLYDALGNVYRYAGLLDESIEAFRRRAALDSSVLGSSDITKALIQEGAYGAAVTTQANLVNAYRAHRHNINGHTFFYLGVAEYYAGHLKSAYANFDSAAAIDPQSVFSLFGQAYKEATEHRSGRAKEILATLERRNLADAEQVYRIAHIYAILGEQKPALAALQEAVDGGFFNYPYINSDPILAGIRNTPGYRAMLDAVRKRHEAFRKQFGTSPLPAAG